MVSRWYRDGNITTVLHHRDGPMYSGTAVLIHHYASSYVRSYVTFYTMLHAIMYIITCYKYPNTFWFKSFSICKIVCVNAIGETKRRTMMMKRIDSSLSSFSFAVILVYRSIDHPTYRRRVRRVRCRRIHCAVSTPTLRRPTSIVRRIAAVSLLYRRYHTVIP